jgi:hypothetical protein
MDRLLFLTMSSATLATTLNELKADESMDRLLSAHVMALHGIGGSREARKKALATAAAGRNRNVVGGGGFADEQQQDHAPLVEYGARFSITKFALEDAFGSQASMHVTNSMPLE